MTAIVHKILKMACSEGESSLQNEDILFPEDNFDEMLEILEEDDDLDVFADEVSENVSKLFLLKGN